MSPDLRRGRGWRARDLGLRWHVEVSSTAREDPVISPREPSTTPLLLGLPVGVLHEIELRDAQAQPAWVRRTLAHMHELRIAARSPAVTGPVDIGSLEVVAAMHDVATGRVSLLR